MTSARGESSRGDRRTRALRGGAVILGVIALWQIIVSLELYTPILLPSPGRVLEAAVALIANGRLFEYTLVSMWRVFAGFLVAVAIAVPLGILIGWSSRADHYLGPLIELIRPVPPLAIFPLVILWLGIGDPARIAVITYGCFFPILISTTVGVRGVEPTLVRAARSLGASHRRVFTRVVIPAAVPSIVAGLRVGAGLAFFVLVAAELIASNSGLGFLILDASQRLRSDQVFVGIITIGLLGLIINRGLLQLEVRIVGHRRPTE